MKNRHHNNPYFPTLSTENEPGPGMAARRIRQWLPEIGIRKHLHQSDQRFGERLLRIVQRQTQG